MSEDQSEERGGPTPPADALDPDETDETARLELPSLGGMFRRRRKPAAEAAQTAEEASRTEAEAARTGDEVEAGATQPIGTALSKVRPVEPAVDAEPEPRPEPEVAEPDPPPPAPTEHDPEPDPDPEPEPAPEPEPDPEPEPEPVDDRTESITPAAADLEPDASTEEWAPATPEPTTPAPDEPAEPARRRLTVPPLSPQVAAPVTGALVGLLGVVLTYLSQRGCEAVRGVGSCGGPGIVLLVAILGLMVLLGFVLLAAWKIGDMLSTSFLGVAIVAVVAMLFLLGVIDRWWMVIVIPVLGAAAFFVAWWGTHRFGARPD